MDLSDKPNVYIILVNWNGWKDTVECLRSLQKLDYPDYSVIVVDNGSSDQSVQQIRQRVTDIHLIENEENLGFAGGNNVGIRHALEREADYIWLLNNDTVVKADTLSHLVRRIERGTNIGICGSKLIYYHDRDKLQALGGGYFNKWLGTITTLGSQKSADISINLEEVETSLDYIIGASMLVTKEFLNEVGLLNEEYFLYYEEIDWAMRSGDQFQLGFAPKSIVYHKEGASTGGQKSQEYSRSKQSDYY